MNPGWVIVIGLLLVLAYSIWLDNNDKDDFA